MTEPDATRTNDLPLPGAAGRQEFLKKVNDRRRSVVVNELLAVIRAGETDPARIVAGARDRLRGKLRCCQEPEKEPALLESIAALDSPEALDAATWYVAYERLPRGVRAARKARRVQAEQQAWMETQAPTDRQWAFLRGLGWTGPVKNRAEASNLISDLLARRKKSWLI